MGILNDLRARVESVSKGLGGPLIGDVLQRHAQDILELQKIQLLQGLTSSGEDIHPFYSEDLKPNGWFTTVDAAKRYAAWKQDLSYPYEVSRNPDAPNIYINGRFHSELDVRFDPDSVVIFGGSTYAAGIVAKYGLSTFGLMPSNWSAIFQEKGAYDELMNEIKTILYV